MGERNVFISYARLDNEPPPDGQKDYGFVSYLLRQIRFDLTDLGAPKALLWHDRGQIAPGDDFTDKISQALHDAELFVAVLSRNYVTRPWCKKELSTMSRRIRKLDARLQEGRIFRVDKHRLLDEEIPVNLRNIESVQFYSKDGEAEREDEYFWNGRVRRREEYENAVRKLTWAIYGRLKQLGVDLNLAEPTPAVVEKFPDNGRFIFVAKPASDMVEAYRTLVRELRGSGYRVVPNPDEVYDKADGANVEAAVKAAEASVHLLGERRGKGLKGHNLDFVQFQLSAAGNKASKTKDFLRIIWAPEVMPQSGSDQAGVEPRDPLVVFAQFGGRLRQKYDHVVGDTLSQFNQIVLRQLERMRVNPGKGRGNQKITGRDGRDGPHSLIRAVAGTAAQVKKRAAR